MPNPDPMRANLKLDLKRNIEISKRNLPLSISLRHVVVVLVVFAMVLSGGRERWGYAIILHWHNTITTNVVWLNRCWLQRMVKSSYIFHTYNDLQFTHIY